MLRVCPDLQRAIANPYQVKDTVLYYFDRKTVVTDLHGIVLREL